MSEQQEEKDFADMMYRHAAPFTEYLGRYASRLSKRDREHFMKRSLEIAWERRAALHPENKSILAWWEDCLRAVATERPSWDVITGGGWRTVKGRRLGR